MKMKRRMIFGACTVTIVLIGITVWSRARPAAFFGSAEAALNVGMEAPFEPSPFVPAASTPPAPRGLRITGRVLWGSAPVPGARIELKERGTSGCSSCRAW